MAGINYSTGTVNGSDGKARQFRDLHPVRSVSCAGPHIMEEDQVPIPFFGAKGRIFGAVQPVYQFR